MAVFRSVCLVVVLSLVCFSDLAQAQIFNKRSSGSSNSERSIPYSATPAPTRPVYTPPRVTDPGVLVQRPQRGQYNSGLPKSVMDMYRNAARTVNPEHLGVRGAGVQTQDDLTKAMLVEQTGQIADMIQAERAAVQRAWQAQDVFKRNMDKALAQYQNSPEDFMPPVNVASPESSVFKKPTTPQGISGEADQDDNGEQILLRRPTFMIQ